MEATEITQTVRIDNRDLWYDVVCRNILDGDSRVLDRNVFLAEIVTSAPFDIQFQRVSSVSQAFARCPQHIRRSGEEYFVLLAQIRGACYCVQDGREASFKEGDLVCNDTTRPFVVEFPCEFEQIIVRMPREPIAKLLGRTENLTARICRPDSPLGSIVSPYLRQVATVLGQVDFSAARRLSEIAMSLIMTTIAETAGKPSANSTWSRNALAHRAKVFIDIHARDSSLKPATVASALRISTRYLQEIFRAEGTTPAEYIWTCRLGKCRQDLFDPLMQWLTITDIALRGGFEDSAHFSRRFRAAFGMSPRDFRAQSQKTNSRLATMHDEHGTGTKERTR